VPIVVSVVISGAGAPVLRVSVDAVQVRRVTWD
jgi:hypothetical protein